ncbi:isoleucine--tRNA ligase [Acetohalobium arabaticum]|uniref:Isoleucine--tRNA ligase n=1 Tax=Acetohalobium arabaticum (strain ATCC 49924 / DSM 5501 / Z-7288) TaxID=574087 RepID=D9QPH6_ACEAZ|nr:isoleucine--tRNA ligase [Acetohalobium arabaticum]ADL12417.1 Isoleucyl-tRNA synthetase [Acetohalobium arabaticum DSM 5501]
MDYKETLNLPETEFQMRANLSEREEEFQEYWEENEIYDEALKNREGAEKFILHDGPPYANGDIHIGHALNQVLKDILTRYKTLQGYQSPYIPGWDTHGLPIEHQITKELGDKIEELSTAELREECKNYALKYIDRQREQFKRLGAWGEWDNPYVTLDPEYEAKQIEVFGEIIKNGYLSKGMKPVYWCPHCNTALAEAEVEYEEARAPSIYVKFPVQEGITVGDTELTAEDSYVVIWTTTPWTIPSNMAITVHPDFDYVVAEAEGDLLVVAKELVDEMMEIVGIDEYEIVEEIEGDALEGLVTTHPFFDRESPIIFGDHVTLEQGTGCVHTAPGHGHEDYVIGVEYDLPVFAPMDNDGVFTEEAGPFAGMYYDDANIKVTDMLEDDDLLMNLDFIDHSYPNCWRCKNPIIFRATEQWFASVDAIKDDALETIKDVDWYPEWGEERMANMIEDRSDWCISRQKSWGVPIPIFYCQDCGADIATDETIKAVKELFAEEGSNAWFEKTAEEILPAGFECPECGEIEFEKESDIMDVWFDSGSSHASVLEIREELERPADIYLEGTDQYRGWFNSSLLTSIAYKGEAPYKGVVTNGFTVDANGKKMSKSQGNVVSPHEVIDQYGADILRLWVASSDFKEDVRVSDKILQQNAEVYRRIRNTFRYILGNMDNFDPVENTVEYDELLEIDKWALHKLQKLVDEITEAYEEYDYHKLYHKVHNFCATEMSSFYMDVLKDRLYTSVTDSTKRRAAQTAMYEILTTLIKVLSPVLVHTAEEAWQHLPESGKEAESVFLTDWPEVKEDYINEELEAKWDRLLTIREDVSKALELARNEDIVGHSLDAGIEIYASEEVNDFLKQFDNLADLFIVSKVELAAKENADVTTYTGEETDIEVVVEAAPGEKCDRCWKYRTSVGDNEDHPEICAECLEVVNQL